MSKIKETKTTTYKIIRYRGKDGVWSWNVVQTGIETKDKAIEGAKKMALLSVNKSRNYRFVVAPSDFSPKKYFENLK